MIVRVDLEVARNGAAEDESGCQEPQHGDVVLDLDRAQGPVPEGDDGGGAGVMGVDLVGGSLSRGRTRDASLGATSTTVSPAVSS